MIKFEEYFVSNSDGKSNCIIRSFCKMFNKEYDEVFDELVDIANKLNYDSYAEIEVFEKYLEDRKFLPIDNYKDTQIKDLSLDNSKYIIFCYDKKDWYHMVPIIDNTLYDKTEESLDLYVITVYKNTAK